MASLASSFHGASRGAGGDADGRLEAALEDFSRQGLAAWPDGALGGLPRHSRTMLRFTFVERLTPARIAAMHGVHRTTAMRWIDAAQEEVLALTRSRMMERLNLSPAECDSVVALVRSRVEITLASLLKTA